MDGVKSSPRTPRGMGMREMADMFWGLRSRPTCKGTLAAVEEVGGEGAEGGRVDA